MTLNIRSFLPRDQEMVQSLVLQGLGEHFGRIDPTLNPDLNDINQTYIQAGHDFIVVERNEEIVGTAALITEAPEIGRIVRVTVKPNQRRAGIGRKLVQHLIDTAEQKAYKHIVVETNIDWYDAIRLYERCGFIEYDRDDEEVHFFLSL